MDRDVVVTPVACPACKAAIAETQGDSWCYACGSSLPEEVIAHLPALQARLNSPRMFTATVEEIDPRVAGFGIRGLARAIDIVVGYVLLFVATVVAVMVSLIRDPEALAETTASPDPFPWTAFLAILIANILYHSISEAMAGASVGKLALGLRVMSEDFSPPSFRGTLIRSVVYYGDAVFFGLIAYYYMKRSPFRQRYGDERGGTIVVRAKSVRVAHRGAAAVLLGLLLAMTAAVTVMAIEAVIRFAGPR